MKKKLALFVAWALLATGVVMGSSSPASALEGEPFPFTAQFGGYGTGTGVHADLVQQLDPTTGEGQRLIGADLGFSGASVDSAGLTEPVVNEMATTVQPTASEPLDDVDPGDEDPVGSLANQEAYGRGSGVELGIGEGLPTDPARTLTFPTDLVEAASSPPVATGDEVTPPSNANDTGLHEDTLVTVPASDLLYAEVAKGKARAMFDDNFCLTQASGLEPIPTQDPVDPADPPSDEKLAYGRGYVAKAQLLETGADPIEDDPDHEAPVVQVSDPQGTGVDTRSFTYLIPNPLPAGAPESARTYAVVSETRGQVAPVSIGPPSAETFGYPQLTVKVLGEWVLRVIVTGDDQSRVEWEPPEIKLVQPPDPTSPDFDPLNPQPVETTIIPGDNNIDLGGIIVITEDPRAKAAPGEAPDADSQPVVTDTFAEAALDVVRVKIPVLADVRIGHAEVSAFAPEDGINCPGSVDILKDWDEDATGTDFPFTVSCTDPNPDPGESASIDLTPGEDGDDRTVVVPGAAPTPDPPDGHTHDAAVNSGPLPSGATCTVTEEPVPGWTTTSDNPQGVGPIVTNEFGEPAMHEVHFTNQRVREPGTLVIEKFVPEDNTALQEFTFEFSISCVDPEGNPLETAGTENLPAERRIQPAALPEDEDPDPDVEPNPDPQPWYGDTRGEGSFTRPVVELPAGSECTVTEEDDPNYQADPNHSDYDPQADPLYSSQPPQTVEIVGGAENVVTFRNDPPPPGAGDLIIVKDAPDDDEAQATNFDFSVTCPDGAANEAFDRDIVGDGQSQPVVGIAEGTVCTVHEDVPPGFVVDQNDQQVTIRQNTTEVVTFVNRRPNVDGQLVVTKDAPDDAQDVEFDFSVDCPTFFEQPIDVRLTGDDSSDIIGVPAGTECTVHEFTEPGFVSQPDVTVTVLPPPAVTEAIFINERVGPGVGTLTVTKDAPPDAQNVIFTFSISCPDLFNEPFARSVVGDATSEPVVGIPAGITCRISEATQDGFLPQPDQQILINDGPNGVTFVNTRGGPAVGDVRFNRQPAPPAVAANAQPRYTG